MENIKRKGEDLSLQPLKFDQLEQFFNMIDGDKDGAVSIEDLLSALNDRGGSVPQRIIQGLRNKILKADTNNDCTITFEEFSALVRGKDGTSFNRLMQKYIHYTIAGRVRNDVTDGEYEEEYSCNPPKLCMIIFTLIELATFIYDWVLYGGAIREDSLAQILIYDPYKRKEVWRYITYMFVHMGIPHLFVNLLVQILLGIPLEMVHGNLRVLCIYIAGVLAGSLGTSVSDPSVFLAGASGGVYALMTAHIATIIMNWTEMKFALYQLFIFGCLIVVDVGSALFARYADNEDSNRIGYIAHLAGAITGLLVGINVLRNLRIKSWEKKVWWASLVLFIILIGTAVTINVAMPSHFPPQKV